MILETPRRRRRLPARILWLLALTVVAVVAAVTALSGANTRAELVYLETMRDQAQELAVGGDSLREVVSRLARVERSELETVDKDLRSRLQVGIELVEAGPPTERLIAANSLYRQALESWTVGLSGYTSAILAAADNPRGEVVVDNIANALAELRSGDRLYMDLRRELELDEIPDPVGPMPSVQLLPFEGELFTLARAYVDAARSVNSRIPLRPSLALSQIVSEPTWEVNPSDQVVLPFTETVTISVVVSNVGNVDSVPEPLVLTMSGDGDPVELTESVPALRPGEQTTIVFPDLPVVAGGIHEVTAELRITNFDSDLTDNLLSVMFSVNRPVEG